MIAINSGAADKESPFVLWDNVLARGALSGLHTASGWENLPGPQTFDLWSWGAGTSSYVQALFVDPVECDCIALAGQNLASIGGSFRAQYSVDGVTSWQTIAPTNTPADATPAAVIFPTVAARGWRYSVVRPTGAFALNVGFLGKRLILPAPVLPPYTPADQAARVEFEAAVSMGGHFMGGSTYAGGLETEVQLAPVPRSFVESAGFKAFRDHFNRGGTFFFGSNPTALPDDLGYYWRSGEELRPNLRGGNWWADLKWKAAGYAG